MAVTGRPVRWNRRYPPLAALAIAIVLTLFVLPSALNLPQANPATTVELAPVPPNDQRTPPVSSNVSTLSFGQTPSQSGSGAQGGTTGTEGGGLPPQVPEPIRSKSPSTKSCVGTPPRQTEDPLSPPCVADFTGDNAGATYQGVTGQEVRIVLYFDGGITSTPTARGSDTTPTNEIIDVDRPPDPNEHPDVWVNRAWEAYFNNRFQLYGRRAHFYVQFSSLDPNSSTGVPFTPTSRQADAAQIYAAVRPFAVISYATFAGAADFYLEYLAQRGVLNFGSVTGRSEAFFQHYPKLLWGYPPPFEQQAAAFTSLVCAKLAPFSVSFSGSGIAHGQPRKFGLVETTDTGFPNLRTEAQLVRSQLKAQCGIDIPDRDVVTYPTNGYIIDTSNTPEYAVNNMLKLSQDHVTTVLWPGGIEAKQSAAATQLSYFPEWVLGDDPFQAANGVGENQDQTQWAHVWIQTSVTRLGVLQQQLCYQAYREADPAAADTDVATYSCLEYNDLRQLFTGIQVAGPRLGPYSVDKGFHAIPSVASTDPRIPACFYNAGDYTCVKDDTLEWFDPTAHNYSNPNENDTGQGCWRMAGGGQRYLSGDYGRGDLAALRHANDPCNTYDIQPQLNDAPP